MKKSKFTIKLILLIMSIFIYAKPSKISQEAITEKQFDINNIYDISINQFATVELEYSTKNFISIFTDSSNHKYVKLVKSKNTVAIYIDKNRPTNFHSNEMKIVIHTNQLKKLTTIKVAKLKCINQFISDTLNITTTSTSSVKINTKSEEFVYNGNACANVSIVGNSEKSYLKCIGISKFDISQFQSEIVNIDAKSCAKLLLHAEKELQIKANSVSKIIYNGKFKIINEEITSVANVQHN